MDLQAKLKAETTEQAVVENPNEKLFNAAY